MSIAVLYDIDGTLVTFKFDAKGARGALIDELRASGFDVAALSLATPTQTIIDAARRQMRDMGSESGFPEVRSRLFRVLDRFEEEGAQEAVPFPQASSVVERLKGLGVPQAVLTNSGRKAALAVLQRSGYLESFDFVLTRDDVTAMKPSPEGVLNAVQRFSLPKGSVFYVGDSVMDIAASRAAGVRSVSVVTGNYAAERLRAEGADFVITSLAELPGIIGR